MAVVCETWRIYRHVTEDRETVCTLFESLVRETVCTLIESLVRETVCTLIESLFRETVCTLFESLVRETVCTLFESLVTPVTYKHLNHLYNVQCPTVYSKFKFVSLDFQ